MTPDSGSERDTFDVYANSFGVTITPMGANLRFTLNKAEAQADDPDPVEHLGAVHMSNELLKLLAYYLRAYIIHHERQLDVEWPIPESILSQSNITRRDWDAFWGYRTKEAI